MSSTPPLSLISKTDLVFESEGEVGSFWAQPAVQRAQCFCVELLLSDEK